MWIIKLTWPIWPIEIRTLTVLTGGAAFRQLKVNGAEAVFVCCCQVDVISQIFFGYIVNDEGCSDEAEILRIDCRIVDWRVVEHFGAEATLGHPGS